MTYIATSYEYKGKVLRSGGADGADTAFQRGVRDPSKRQIFLPWDGFNGLKHCPENGIFYWKYLTGHKLAAETVRRYHPAPDRLSAGGFSLMARNAMQILGPTMDDPVELVVCYAPLDKKGNPKGGTSQAIRIAQDHGIQVKNLADESVLEPLRLFWPLTST